jgi:pyroglutamyl-peptidase
VSGKRTVLLTGFGPFPGAPFNPSGPLVRKLARLRRPALADLRLVPHVFATSYRSVDTELPQMIARYRPDVLLMFGLATRSRHVRIETQARNTLAVLPDASGFVPAANAIRPMQPSRLPIRGPRAALLRAARGGRIPARLSRDAGRYLCNYLYWHGLEFAARPGGPRLVVFIHIPNVRRQPRRTRRGRIAFAFGDLVRVGENMLMAIAAALKCGPRP